MPEQNQLPTIRQFQVLSILHIAMRFFECRFEQSQTMRQKENIPDIAYSIMLLTERGLLGLTTLVKLRHQVSDIS